MMKLNVALLLVASALEHVQQSGKFLAQDHAHIASTTTDGVPPVSTTMKCVINLVIQFFLLYTAIAIVKTYNEFAAVKADGALKNLMSASKTMNYAPMLCVLFVGVRMRALQLTQGDPDSYDLPQPYVKNAMQCCAWSVLVQTILVLLLPVFIGDVEVEADGTPKAAIPGVGGQVVTLIRYAAMLAMYGGFTAVCVGAQMMEAPVALYPSGTPPVSPAVGCTMNLCFQYFAVYLAIQLIKTFKDFGGKMSDTMKTVEGTLEFCEQTVVFAPMLCILFIGARMRALQMDPVNGNPQVWAQNCFYLCAYAVLGQVILLFLIPFAIGGKLIQDDKAAAGDVKFEMAQGSSDGAFKALLSVRFVIMAALYGGFTAVIVSVIVIEHPEGAEKTPEISPAMQCVMNLTMQYFFVYLCLWVLITYKQVGTASSAVDTSINTFDTATKTVLFCPMLSVLFIGLRLRALQITDQKGAPQGWAQQGMFLSTWAVMVQLAMILLFGAVYGKVNTDADGNVVVEAGAEKKESSNVIGYIVQAVRYLALIAQYGGAITVVYALFVITPETANGVGVLIPGVEVPTPVGA